MSKTQRRCPRCDEPGRAVTAATIENLVRADARASLASLAYFCPTPACEVVYFDTRGGTVPTAGVRVAVFQKETSPKCPVCYCFEHTADDVLAATRTDGSNVVVDEIMAACSRGLDRCEETNPQGRCCLSNVRALLRAKPPRIEACPRPSTRAGPRAKRRRVRACRRRCC